MSEALQDQIASVLDSALQCTAARGLSHAARLTRVACVFAVCVYNQTTLRTSTAMVQRMGAPSSVDPQTQPNPGRWPHLRVTGERCCRRSASVKAVKAR